MADLQAIQLEGIDEARKLFSPEKFKKASTRAVGKALDKSLTTASRQIRQKWNIKKKALETNALIPTPPLAKRLRFIGDVPVGYLTARSRPLSWRFFGGVQVAKGVKVKISKWSTMKTRPDSFWATNLQGESGNQAAGYGFVTKYNKRIKRKRAPRSDRKFKPKDSGVKPRLKLRFNRVITVASMFKQTNAYNPTIKIAGETWQKEFIRQLTLCLQPNY